MGACRSADLKGKRVLITGASRRLGGHTVGRA